MSATFIEEKPMPERNEKGERIIDEKYICKLCKYNGGYSTPEYNHTCYLHFIGISKINFLDNFVNLIHLYLDNNTILKIEGLEKLKKLRSLYLQNNFISKIENLENNTDLVNLNLSGNKIKRIENLKCLKGLENLYLSKNFISCPEDIEEIENNSEISLLDFSENEIKDDKYFEELIKIFQKTKKIKVIYLKGNEFIRKIKNYRRTFIVEVKTLSYLDDRFITEEDRVGTEAYFKGGHAEEVKARNLYRTQNDKLAEIRERESSTAINFEECKKTTITSIENDYLQRKTILEEKKNKLMELYQNSNENLDELNLKLFSVNFQLEENERWRKEEEGENLIFNISQRESKEAELGFKYESWMDDIIEETVIENFMNFEDALNILHSIFKKKGVKNYELFTQLDLRNKWTEFELNKFRTKEENKFFFYINPEELVIEEDSYEKLDLKNVRQFNYSSYGHENFEGKETNYKDIGNINKNIFDEGLEIKKEKGKLKIIEEDIKEENLENAKVIETHEEEKVKEKPINDLDELD